MWGIYGAGFNAILETSLSLSFFLSLLKIQHLDLSNCTVSVADLHSILCLCEKLLNLSLEGLVLSDNIIK